MRHQSSVLILVAVTCAALAYACSLPTPAPPSAAPTPAAIDLSPDARARMDAAVVAACDAAGADACSRVQFVEALPATDGGRAAVRVSYAYLRAGRTVILRATFSPDGRELYDQAILGNP